MSVAVLLAVLASAAAAAAAGADEPLPERFLPPRDFNPHPFERGGLLYAARGQDGAGAGESAAGIASTGEVLEPHPYALLARKRPREGRYPHHRLGEPVLYPHPTSVLNELHRSTARAKLHRQNQEQQDQQHQAAPGVPEGFYPVHPGKQEVLQQQPVLLYEQREPSQHLHLQDDGGHHHGSAENYAFSYSVRDTGSGDNYAHSQARSGGGTRGEYRVRLPDGRLQIVSYIADNHGYRADVRYDGAEAGHPSLSTGHPHLAPEAHQYEQASPSPEGGDGGEPIAHQYVHAAPSPAPLPVAHQYVHPAAHQYVHASPAPGQQYVHASPAPAPQYVHASPAPAPQYVHASPAPAPQYVHASPAPAEQYVHASPAPAQQYVHASPAPAHQYVHASPAPAQQYVHASPTPATAPFVHQYVHASPSPAAHQYVQVSPSPSSEPAADPLGPVGSAAPQYIHQQYGAAPQYLDEAQYLSQDDGFFVTPAAPAASASPLYPGSEGHLDPSGFLALRPAPPESRIPTTASPPPDNTASPAPIQFPRVPDDDQQRSPGATAAPIRRPLELSARHASDAHPQHRFA